MLNHVTFKRCLHQDSFGLGCLKTAVSIGRAKCPIVVKHAMNKIAPATIVDGFVKPGIAKFGFRSFIFILFSIFWIQSAVGFCPKQTFYLVMPTKHRNVYRCPVCGDPIKRLTPHMKVQHMDVMKTAYFCALYANHARLQDHTTYRGRAYKICPVDGCPSITADMPLHLRGRGSGRDPPRSRHSQWPTSCGLCRPCGAGDPGHPCS